MKKKKRGTTLKPPKKPCLKCVRIDRCDIEDEFSRSTMHWRFRKGGRTERIGELVIVEPTTKIAKKCKRFWEYLEKVDSFADQSHGSKREVSYSQTVFNSEGNAADESYLLDRFSRGQDRWKFMANYFHADKVAFPFLQDIDNRILHLFHFEGLRIREIVRTLGGGRDKKTAIRLTVDAVKKRKARAEAKIDKWAEEYIEKHKSKPKIIRVKTSERVAARAKKKRF